MQPGNTYAADEQAGGGAQASGPKGRGWRIKKRWVALVILLAGWAVIGPWPADNRGFEDSAYQQWTLAKLGATGPALAEGALEVGMAEVDISPAEGHPMAGYSRNPHARVEGVDGPCRARALTVGCGDVKVTILTADLLMVTAELRAAVLAKTGLKAEEIYFSASHTHTGPGGYARKFIERPTFGAFDAAYFEKLAGQLAKAVTESRATLQAAEVGVVTAYPEGMQHNRVEKGGKSYDQLTAVVFRRAEEKAKPKAKGQAAVTAKPAGNPLAILVVFGAHATTIGARAHRLSPDYPGALVETLKRETGAKMVCFAAGAVGDATPTRFPAGDGFASARLLGEALAGALLPAIKEQTKYAGQVTLGSLVLEVQMPPTRICMGTQWQFSPIWGKLLTDGKTHLQMVRIGPVVLAGFPADYAGGLAEELATWAQRRGATLAATSFNGDYLGYLVGKDVFLREGGYETRSLNFFGPWAGPYVNDLAERMMEKLGLTGVGG
ncbi:MAG: neutral/alkaline non-lysosomal ceramidase N-terminal domain-containing protein [Phycisphaeraceae bacterium]|nr:neutral/alkaline non-lysosomal ceramidase N-terminal domain-containing protein [Phycisphaeraceae bacterium]